MQSTLSKQVQRNILLVALFCTAFSSLVYELVWSRELSYVFGNTALATSSVLAVFMGGLALGSLYAGKILESRNRPFRFLVWLQFIIGIICILTLFAIKGIDGLQSYLFSFIGEQTTFGIRVILFLLTCCVLIAPTFLIGVAFPCIVQLYHRSKELVGQSVSRCYWIDTLGASLGMLLAAFFLAPRIGFFRTSLVASMLNAFTGILVFLFFRKADAGLEKSATEAVNHPQDFDEISRATMPETATAQNLPKQLDLKVVSFLFFLSGFAALVLEVVWIRHWGLIYGGGLYAFAIVVVTFLLGLSIGSLLYDKFLKRIRNQVLLFSTIELCLGGTAVIVTVLFPYVESVFLKIYYGTDSYYAFMITLGSLCFALLLVPTILMGMTLPSLCAVKVSERHIAIDFGKLYAANSLGALAGSFCAGFIIIPALGIFISSFVAAGVYIFVAFAFLYCFCKYSLVLRRTTAVFVLILILTGVAFAGLYKPNHVYSGVYYTGTMYDKEDAHLFLERQKRELHHLRFLKDNVYGQVTVAGTSNGMLLRTNGKVESGTSGDLTAYQSLLGHIPVLVHNKPSNVLNIGFGCGWTIRAATMHPAVESIDCVEINPLIIEVNKNIFHSYNGDVINNPKLHIIINDGRIHVAHTRKVYDVIVSEIELSSPETSALFTREFYNSIYSILSEDGILSQWFPRYEVTEEDYKIALNTIKGTFPYVYEFDLSKLTMDEYYKSFLILACKEPMNVDERLEQHKIAREDQPKEYHSYLLQLIPVVQKTCGRDNKALESYIADVNKVNTDDLPLLEFHAYKNRYRKFKKE